MLSDVIVEDIVGLCTCTCSYKKAMVYYSIVFVVVYMKSCLPTNCDNVVSCIKTLSLCRVPCVSVPPILSYINLNCLSCGATENKMWEHYCLQIGVCCGLKSCGDVFM